MFIPKDTGAQFRDVNLICGKYGDITDLRAMIVKSLEEYEVTLGSLSWPWVFVDPWSLKSWFFKTMKDWVTHKYIPLNILDGSKRTIVVLLVGTRTVQLLNSSLEYISSRSKCRKITFLLHRNLLDFLDPKGSVFSSKDVCNWCETKKTMRFGTLPKQCFGSSIHDLISRAESLLDYPGLSGVWVYHIFSLV